MNWDEILRMWSPLIQTVLEGLIAIAVPVIVIHVRRWLMAAELQVQSRLTQDQYTFTRWVVEGFVKAAEQMYTEADGSEKLNYVLRQSQSILAQQGLELDLTYLRAHIEEAVKDMNDKQVRALPA